MFEYPLGTYQNPYKQDDKDYIENKITSTKYREAFDNLLKVDESVGTGLGVCFVTFGSKTQCRKFEKECDGYFHHYYGKVYRIQNTKYWIEKVREYGGVLSRKYSPILFISFPDDLKSFVKDLVTKQNLQEDY